MSRRTQAKTLHALALLPGAAACDPPRRDPPRGPGPTATATATAPPPPPPAARVLVDLVQSLPRCDLDHRGPLLDAGTEAMVGRYGWVRGIPAGIAPAEHDGSTW